MSAAPLKNLVSEAVAKAGNAAAARKSSPDDVPEVSAEAAAEPLERDQAGALRESEAEELRAALAQSFGVPRHAEQPGSPDGELGSGGGANGKVIAFLHVTGGAGATTVAVNTACALSEPGAAVGCGLIDLDLQFGSVAGYLDMPSTSSLQSLIDDPLRLQRVPFGQMFAAHSSGVQVMTAPRSPVALQALQPAAVSALLEASKYRFRNVVIDMPVAICAFTETVLNMASQVYLVTPMNVAAAQRLARFFHLLHQHDLGHLPVGIVVNRALKSGKAGTIPAAQFEAAVGREVNHSIPEEYPLVQQSQNQGTPAIVLGPRSAFAQAIREIAAGETGGSLLARPRRSLFGRL